MGGEVRARLHAGGDGTRRCDLPRSTPALGRRLGRLVLPGSGASRDRLPLRPRDFDAGDHRCRSEEHTSELQSLMRISYAVFCLKKKKKNKRIYKDILINSKNYITEIELMTYTSTLYKCDDISD